MDGMRADSGVNIVLRQSKHMNTTVAQDQRAIKRIVRPMTGFKSFDCARSVIAGIETVHRIKNFQVVDSRASTCVSPPTAGPARVHSASQISPLCR